MFDFLYGLVDEDFHRSDHQLVVSNEHGEDEEPLTRGEDGVQGDHHLVRPVDGPFILSEEFPDLKTHI